MNAELRNERLERDKTSKKLEKLNQELKYQCLGDVLTRVRAVLALAEASPLETIAEGVETQEELKILMKLGCTKIQGFLLSKAIPLNECLQQEISRKGLL